jgi:TonB family protein
MNRIPVLLLLFSSLSFAQAHGALSLPDTLYMNRFYERTSQEQADLLRIIEGRDPDSLGYVFREYDKNGRLTNSGITKELYGSLNGMIASYYENGVKKDEGHLEKTRKGLWKEWYQNGQLKAEVEHPEKEGGKRVVKMINFNDSLGNALVISGTGLFKEYYRNNVYGQLKTKGRYHNHYPVGEWEGYDEKGRLAYQESYSEQGELLQGISYDASGKRYEYTEMEIMPSPADGMKGFFRFVVRKLKYPKAAAKNGIQGRVFIQFVVDKDGSIIDVEVLKGISKECDEEALRVMKLMKN